jgi:hypothetical protein
MKENVINKKNNLGLTGVETSNITNIPSFFLTKYVPKVVVTCDLNCSRH